MGHGHGISPAPAGSASARYVNRLWIAAGLGLITLVAQVVVGLRTSSLALLSDSAHVFTDVLGIFMAVGAIGLARRASRRTDQTFGMYRAEVFAALFNAVLLFVVAGWVLYEAVDRISTPPEVPGLPVTIVAVVGLTMNLAAFLLLRSGATESINVRGAYLEVMADMLGSLGVLAGGLTTLLFGWRYADPVIGVAIGLFVLPRAFDLGKGALRILFQHAPERIDLAQVSAQLAGMPGVVDSHDLHVWTLTSGMEVASTHLIIEDGTDPRAVLEQARSLLAGKYHLDHATLQIESQDAARGCHDLPW